MLRRAGGTDDMISHLIMWENSPIFTERERAALDLAERMTRNEPVDDALWAELIRHFPDEGEIVELVTCIAAFNAFNRMATALRVEITR